MENIKIGEENNPNQIIYQQNQHLQSSFSKDNEILKNDFTQLHFNQYHNEEFDKNLKEKIEQQSSDDQENLQRKILQLDLVRVNTTPSDPQVSQHILQYLEKISTTQQTFKNAEDFFEQVDISQIQNQILSNKQFEKCSHYQRQFKVLSIQPTKYYQIVTIWIQCGLYKTKVIILNYLPKQNETNPLHHSAHINGFGAFGNLYFVQCYKENYTVKCIPINKHNQNSQHSLNKAADSITGVLKEYFFLKLFSELNIGPKLKQSFGFDLIVSHDCIEFSMELCKPLVLTPENEQKLIENMKKMHLLQIVHRDIKPDNLMWSEEYQTPVFIDFGVTTFIKERLGYKSMTRFAGTIGFVSPEMTTVFAQKKGVADLYYNDLYGLNQSFAFMKRFTNTQQSVQTQELKPTLIRDSAFTMHLLKHKLLTKKYTEFSQMWQELQKYHFYELESIECGILQFLIDLRPTDFLSKLYRQISEESRSIKQFEGLKDIYMSELSAILSIWTKFPQKQKKFQRIIWMFKQISAEYQLVLNIEKRIEKILIGKQSITRYMSQIRLTIVNTDFTSQNVLIYFIVLAYYCSLAHDKYGIALDDKIQAAKEAINVINVFENKQQIAIWKQSTQQQNIKVFIINLNKLWFLCPLKQLQPLGILYQYIMFHLWPQAPRRFRNDILKFVISSLSLMGYPFYIEAAKDVFKYYLFRDKKSSKLNKVTKIQDRLQKILLFWKSVSMINVYSEICYNRQQNNFLLDKQIVEFLQEEAQAFQQCLMHQNINNSFLVLNHHFYQFHTKTQVVKYPSDLIVKILEKLQKQQFILHSELNWSKYYSQYKESIRLMFNFLPGRAMMPVDLGILYETRPIILQYEESIDLTLHFSSFLKYCIHSWNLQRVGKVLRMINETIVYEKITQRFYVDFRIYVAWKMLDIHAMKKITSLVFQETEKVSSYNLSYLKTISLIIHKILLLQRKGFWDLIIEKLICYDHLQKVIYRMRQYTQFYLKIENLPHPDEILVPIEQIKLNKNIRYKQKYCFIDECTMVNLILNQTEDTLFRTFDCVQTIISLLSSLLRYAIIFLDQGLRKEYDKLLTNREEIDIVTHLRSILPERLKKSLFICEKTQNQFSNFLKSSIKLMSSPEISLSKYYNAFWNQNNKILLQVPIQHCNDFSNMIKNFNKTYQEENLFKRELNNSIETQIKPSPRVGVIYYLSKLISNKQRNLDDYKELISFYKMWINHHEVYKVMFETQMIKYLVNAFVYCEVPYNQFFSFLLDITSFLKSIQDKFAAKIFRQAIWDKFFCVCKYCFPFPPENWKPLQFIKYIYANRKEFTQVSHPYMGVVMIAAIPNQYTPIHIKKKFVIFAIKSMQHLPSNTRQYIMQHVYFEIFILKLIEKGLYQPAQYDQNLIQIKPQVKVKYNDNIIHSQYYHAQKYYKSQKRVGDLNRLIQQRYKVKRNRKPGWKLPQFIQKIYHKKLHRYHLYVNGFDQKVKIQPHVQLLKQIQ